jgi:hypothetical protein
MTEYGIDGCSKDVRSLRPERSGWKKAQVRENVEDDRNKR